MHPQVLPAGRPRRLHGRSIDDICNLRADALLNYLCQCLGLGETFEVELADKRDERREPAPKGLRRGRAAVDRVETRRRAAAVCVADNQNCDDARCDSVFPSNGMQGRGRGKTKERNILCSMPTTAVAYVITESTLSSFGWTWLYVNIFASTFSEMSWRRLGERHTWRYYGGRRHRLVAKR